MISNDIKYYFSCHVVLSCIVLMMTGCAEEKAPAEKIEHPVPVHTVKVVPIDKVQQYKYAGEISPRNEAVLAFRIGGKMLTRTVEVGDKVKRGTEIARLDPKDLYLETDSVKSQIQAAQANHELAKSELERYRVLLEKKFISPAEMERRTNTVKVATANKDTLKARLYSVHQQISYTVLRADKAGVVTAVEAEPGEVLATGQSVVRIAPTKEVEAVISVPENRLNELKMAKQVEVTLWADPGRRYLGKVREVSPLADPATRTFRAKIAIEQPDEHITFGMTASVTLIGDVSREIFVPVSSLYHHKDSNAVWVVDTKKEVVRLVPITVSGFDNERVSVSAGLASGDYVVTKGIHKLHDGQKVRLIAGDLIANE